MTMLVRALVTECLKLRRTLALWMVLLAPFVVVLLYTLILIGCTVGVLWWAWSNALSGM